jgi:hypothetical protein
MPNTIAMIVTVTSSSMNVKPARKPRPSRRAAVMAHRELRCAHRASVVPPPSLGGSRGWWADVARQPEIEAEAVVRAAFAEGDDLEPLLRS